MGHVGAAAAALAAKRLGADAHQIDGADPRDEILGDADHDRSLAVGAPDQGDDAGADVALQIIGEALQILGRDVVEGARRHI